jgi:hypothetical protein
MPTSKHISTWIGFDPREASAYAVARSSIRFWDRQAEIHGVILADLQAKGLYYRPTDRRLGRLYDRLSATKDYNGEMSTEFAVSRFLVPALARKTWKDQNFGGWAIFMDCDVMVRANINHIKAHLDDSKAICCVKHAYEPATAAKMDNQVQTKYSRKNWSSVMAFNLDHEANNTLTVEMVNTLPGRDLHRFCWLDDDEIGKLPPEWNYLVGHTQGVSDPKIVHFTEGGPWFEAFRDVPFADEWRLELERWAR